MIAKSIRVSADLKKELDKHKLYKRDTYEGVIWDLVERHKTVNEKTIKEIEQSRKEFREGKRISHDELKRKLNLH